VNDRREAEDIGPPIPRGPRSAFRSAVRPSGRRDSPHPLQRSREAEARESRVVGGNQHIARMKRPVSDVHRGREVERSCDLCRHANGLGGHRRAVIPDKDVNRLGDDEVLCEIRGDAADARGEGRRDARMREVGVNQRLQLSHQPAHAIGRKIELEELDGNQLVLLGIVGTKDRTQCACSDLMKNAKRTERPWMRSAGSFRVQ